MPFVLTAIRLGGDTRTLRGPCRSVALALPAANVTCEDNGLAQVNTCKPCREYATPHLKNPHAPPGPGNPIVNWILNKGQPGLDTPGDSVAIQQPGTHHSVTINVSAPAGTTLYFMCAVHPWMQGKIIVH